jgi:DNA-binding LacI/PurR family transcriptional regulator
MMSGDWPLAGIRVFDNNHHMSVFMISSDGSVPSQVARQITRLIAQQYQPGEVLPTYRDLAARFQVGLRSVESAMNMLADKGIVRPVRRRGTMVLRQIQPEEAGLRNIGVVSRSTVTDMLVVPYRTQVLLGVGQRVDEIEANLRLFPTRKGRPIPPEDVESAGTEAAILLGAPQHDYIERFSRRRMPVVVADHYDSTIPLDYVTCDNDAAMHAVVEHLASLGHRRIAYLDLAHRIINLDSDHFERREAFHRQMAAFGLEEAGTIQYTHKPVEDDAAETRPYREMLDRIAGREPDRPTAIISDSDEGASLLAVALSHRGIRLPDDLSVAAVSQTRGRTPAPFPFTGCYTGFYEMGLKAMEMLELRCRSPRPAEPNVVRIGFEFEPGQTAAPPPPTD